MDWLSDILALLKIESTSVSQWRLSAPWGVHVTDFQPAYCLTVVDGRPWFRPPAADPVRLAPGDTILALRGGECRLGATPDAATRRLGDLPWHSERTFGPVAQYRPASAVSVDWGGGGEVTRLLGLAFEFQEGPVDFLLSAFPQFIVLSRDDAGLLPLIEPAIAALMVDREPGFMAATSQLAEFVITSLIRSVVLSARDDATGWMRGFQDPQLCRALAAIHAAPEQDWTLPAMARQAGLSRSAFAARFRRLTGFAPAAYLGLLRAQLAALFLRDTRMPLATIAGQVGFNSDRAFRRAFRRVMDVTPLEYRKRYAASA